MLQNRFPDIKQTVYHEQLKTSTTQELETIAIRLMVSSTIEQALQPQQNDS